MTRPKLKRCPFVNCRSTDVDIYATYHPKNNRGVLYWQGKCKDCGATGPAHRTVEQAAIYWGITDETDTTDDTAERHKPPPGDNDE